MVSQRQAGQQHNGNGLFSDGDAIALRLRLITEEFLELTEAMHAVHHQPTTENKAHALKEMCDLLYVTLGTGVVFFKQRFVEMRTRSYTTTT